MKRFLVLLVLGAAAAVAIWLGMRGRSPMAKSSSTTITSLLPNETLAFVHVPDFNGARAKWHETDVYKLWREPAVQEFVQKPLASNPNATRARERFQELSALEVRDAFFAITSWENQQLKIVSGFRFKGTANDAEKVIGTWRTRLQQNAAAKRETTSYEGHQIEVVSENAITIATAYDGNWFFAANDVPALKTLLDRVDKRATDAGSVLTGEENYAAAFKHMPASYAAFGYARLDRYFERLAAKVPQDGSVRDQMATLRQIRSMAAATTFQEGKVRDVFFVSMPKRAETGELTRSSLSLTTSDTFLYAAGFLSLPKQNAVPAAPGAPAMSAVPAVLQRFFEAFAANGITMEDWSAAFGAEFGVVGDWQGNARLPAVLATVPVHDVAKARAIVQAVTSAKMADKPWTTTEKGGVQYHSQAPVNPMVPVAPTIAISDKLLIAGLDATSVEAAMNRGGAGSGGLAGLQTFKTAERFVPPATYGFTYLDTASFYTKLDAAVRPMLIMAAAFMPQIAQTVDLSKVPAADVITRHLSPLVISQNYVKDGYMAESIGPVSVYQAALAILAATGAGANLYQRQMGMTNTTFPAATSTPSPPAPALLPSPTATP